MNAAIFKKKVTYSYFTFYDSFQEDFSYILFLKNVFNHDHCGQ